MYIKLHTKNKDHWNSYLGKFAGGKNKRNKKTEKNTIYHQ